MASRTKKVAEDTVTFKKSDLVKKIKSFLEEHDACEGDWLNKARVTFLGEKNLNICVEATIPVSLTLEMASDGLPSKEEVAERIREQIESGDFGGWDDMDEETFTVTNVTKS